MVKRPLGRNGRLHAVIDSQSAGSRSQFDEFGRTADRFRGVLVRPNGEQLYRPFVTATARFKTGCCLAQTKIPGMNGVAHGDLRDF